MEKLNDFITTNQDTLRKFYGYLAERADEGPYVDPAVPDTVKVNALVLLHKYISLNYDKLKALIQQEDESLAEELQEVMDNIGQIDAEDDHVNY